MKKILIATSALVAVSAPAFALDVKTSGAVEYRYTKDKAGNVAQNAKLSQKDAHIKFAASGASNGLAYGAWIKSKSGTSTTSSIAASGVDVYSGTGGSDGRNYADAPLRVSADVNRGVKSDEAIANGEEDSIWVKLGDDQSGNPVYAQYIIAVTHASAAVSGADVEVKHSDTNRTVTVESIQVGGDKPGVHTASNAAVTPKTSATKTPAKSQTLANNATTQSAIWVSGAFGGLVIGQDGDATGLAPSGSVNAASFTGGTQLASFTAGNKGERVTYTAPTFVDGLKVSYTHNFKGNVSTTKADKVKAPTSYGVQYATDVMGVMVKLGYAQANLGKTKTAKALKNTKTGVELGYGGFTVGYGTFTIGKKAFQKKDTTGTNYGVKYASGAWAVGYTVNKSEDKNKYITHSNKTASTNAISASYKVADGFSVYASKSSNKVKNTNGKTAKNNYTIIGAKIAF